MMPGQTWLVKTAWRVADLQHTSLNLTPSVKGFGA
jgi:hypothetical protein